MSEAGRSPHETRFLHDTVEDWTPIAFAIELTRRLRRHSGIACTPSLRATLAIPRFLTARYARTRRLTPRDYLDAAVLTTPYEDQAIADAVARELLFPRSELAGPPRVRSIEAERAGGPKAAGPKAAGPDAMQNILGDLAALDVGLDAIDDLADLEAMIEEETAASAGEPDPFDLFERLYSSAVPSERALGELVVLFGGAAEMASASARSVPAVRALVRERLLSTVGALTPQHVFHACRADLGDEIAHEARAPWELAGFLAGLGKETLLEEHTNDLARTAAPRELGTTLRFLAPHTVDTRAFRRTVLARPKDLSEHGDLLLGLEEWVDPSQDLLARSARENPRRAMMAARTMRERFGTSLEKDVLEAWVKGLDHAPTLRELVDVAVSAARYGKLVEAAVEEYVLEMREEVDEDESTPDLHEGDPTPPLPRALAAAVVLARDLAATQVPAAVGAARRLATEAPCTVTIADHFLPLLDAFLELAIVPDDIERLVAAAVGLGIDANAVYDRIGQALEQLRAMILGGSHDAERYGRLVDRIQGIPEDMLGELATYACGESNLEAIASLLAIDLGRASAAVGEELTMQALGYKGIGGGANLLKQWFDARTGLVDPLRAKIKSVAKEALVDLAFDWLGQGAGDADRGLVPQQRTRAFRPGDDVDLLDLDASLERLIESGRSLDDAREDDLVVAESVRGQAAISVLIDISGSMSGPDLAMCSIAVVMMLGKLRSDEVSLALFESDTHVVKRFADEADLDAIADQLLDLAARGGTCVDRALRFVETEMASVEAPLRVLFLLSDFAFSESPDQVRELGRTVAEHGVTLLAASHGYVMKTTRDALLSAMPGEEVPLKSVKELPAILIEVLGRVADGIG